MSDRLREDLAAAMKARDRVAIDAIIREQAGYLPDAVGP
jgi:uncharacterized protein YqeY